jgi:hypothetical protein
MGAETQTGELKRLDFVKSYSSQVLDYTYNLASSLYTTGKHYAPASFEPRIKAVEEKVTEVGSPFVSKLQDRGDLVLHTLDSKVDKLLIQAGKFYDSSAAELQAQVNHQKKFHEKNLEHYKQAREAYLKRVEETVDFLKKEGISGAAKLTADTVLARVEDAKQLPAYIDKEAKVVVSRVTEAWNKLASYPAVQKLLATAQPSIDFAWNKYIQAHDTIVASPYYHAYYNKAVDNGSFVLSKVQETQLYSRISPYTDPAIEKVTTSPYYQATVSHLKPIAVNGKA